MKVLKEHATEMINHEKKQQMIPLSYEENKSYKKQKVCYICQKKLILIKMIKINLNYTIK